MIHSCGMTVCRRDWEWDTSRYPLPDYDLWTVLQGEGVLTVEDQEFLVSEGSCMLLRPGGHYIGRQNLQNRMTVIHLHFDVLKGDGTPACLEEEIPLFRQLRELEFVRQLLFKILDAWNGSREEEAGHWLQSVLDEISGQDRLASGGIQTPAGSQIQALCRRIQQNPGGKYRLADLAMEFGYSVDYFGRIFAGTAGKPLSEYVIGVRINQAKLLLRDSGDSVERIAEKLGYGDPCFFCRQFKKWEGCPPGRYRRLLQAAGIKREENRKVLDSIKEGGYIN